MGLVYCCAQKCKPLPFWLKCLRVAARASRVSQTCSSYGWLVSFIFASCLVWNIRTWLALHRALWQSQGGDRFGRALVGMEYFVFATVVDISCTILYAIRRVKLTDIIAIEVICDVIYVGGSILTNVILHRILLEKIGCASEQGVNICGCSWRRVALRWVL